MIDLLMAHKMEWKLETWLDGKGKTRYQLATEMDGQKESNLTTLYRIEKAEQVNLNTLTRIIEACERLTGKRPKLSDILEYKQ
jgi:DNA-binding Xre family transcriptional regulator